MTTMQRLNEYNENAVCFCDQAEYFNLAKTVMSDQQIQVLLK